MTPRRSIAALLVASLAFASGCEKEEDDYEPIPISGANDDDGDDGERRRKTKKKRRQRSAKKTKTSKRKPAPAPPAPPPPAAPGPRVANDPINRFETNFMRRRAKTVLAALVDALPSKQKRLMQSVPLAIDNRPGEVNAFAACTKGRALMAISDGLMEIQAQMARAKANDEIFSTKKFDAYVTLVARNTRPGRAIPRPPRTFYDARQDTDGRKVKRQHELFDEGLAFVLGHELAHHYLSHTGCVGTDAQGLTPADLARGLSQKVPAFNQPNELASDVFGTQNALNAGKRQRGHKWTEAGGLLTIRFFLSLRQTRGGNVLFSFESTHPHPSVRKPVIEETAQSWRRTGGRSLPVLDLPLLR